MNFEKYKGLGNAYLGVTKNLFTSQGSDRVSDWDLSTKKFLLRY